jgi:hypothetical protein
MNQNKERGKFVEITQLRESNNLLQNINLKGLSHEIDFENVDKNVQDLA